MYLCPKLTKQKTRGREAGYKDIVYARPENHNLDIIAAYLLGQPAVMAAELSSKLLIVCLTVEAVKASIER